MLRRLGKGATDDAETPFSPPVTRVPLDGTGADVARP